MSRSQYTYQTTTTVNVSQDYETPARSSPPSEPVPPAGVNREDTELVEDSLNANAAVIADDVEVVEDSVGNQTATHTNANAQASRLSQQAQYQAQSEHDELYSLTPDRPRVRATQELPKTKQHTSPKRKVSNNALDALLTRGANVHKAVQRPAEKKPSAPIVEDDEDELQRSQGSRNAPLGATAPKSAAKGKQPLRQSQAQTSAEDGEDELQSFDDDLSAPVGSHPQSSKKKGKGPTTSKAAVPPSRSTKAAMTSNAGPVSATGSLAALRLRRGQDAGAPAVPPESTISMAVLQPRDANVQTPATNSKNGTKAEHAPAASTAGKLPPVTRNVFAKAPIRGPASSAQKPPSVSAKPAKGRANSPAGDDSIAVVPPPKATQKANEKLQSLKRPAKAMKGTDAAQASTYDVPQSPENQDEDEYRPKKTTRKGKTAQRKRVAASSSVAGSPAPPKKTARKPKTKASKRVSEPDQQTLTAAAGPSRSTRAKMKAESGTAAPVGSAKKAAKASKEVAVDVQEVVDPDAEMPDADSRDFEEAPLMRSSNDDADDPGRSRKSNSARGQQNLSRIKKERLVADDEREDDGRQGDRGGSQQNAIVLSDAQPSSSDEELFSVMETKVAKEQAQLNRMDAGRRQPRTPAALRSSPPVAGGPSTKPTTAGLIDPTSARKSTIISFDKSGPRNQGTASAKSGRLSLAPLERSSLPPTKPSAGSVAKLQARRQERQAAITKPGKEFAREASTLSNVASDAQQALAGLKRQSITQSQPASKHKPATESAPHRAREVEEQAYQDDEFANIDQFGDDTTLIGDYQEPAVNPVRSPRTLSQLQMPPPMSMTKAEQKRPINSAPTVPSMARTEVEGTRHPSKSLSKSSVLGKRQQVEEPAATDVKSKRIRRTEPKALKQHSSSDSMPETTVVQRKPAQVQKQSEAVQQRENSQRQTKRQRSQGTVDIHGSPVPEGMVVDGHNTVLETFSQHAALSSDQVDIDLKSAVKDRPIESSDLLTVRAAQKQPARLSSNTKTVPAEPGQESQAITHVARVQTGRPFVTADKTAHPPTDPFTSSEEERNQPAQKVGASAFSKHLKEQVARGPAANKTIQGPQQDDEDDDPEKTLVEAEEEPEPAAPQRRPKRIESFDSVSSSEMSSDTEDTSASLQDMGVWRKALRPHQMNLFDELVNISHKLVRHLVDKEEASSNIVDDYRRRGEELVQSLRVGQSEDMKEYYVSLKDRKKRLQKEMGECGRRLAECADEVKIARKEVRKQAVAARADNEVDLKDVMGAFC